MFLFFLPPNTYFKSSVRLVCQNLVEFHIVTAFKVEKLFSDKNNAENIKCRIIWKKSKYIISIFNDVLAKRMKKKPLMVSKFENTIAKFVSLFLVKPNRPENVTFFWNEDTVTVSCNKPERAVKCLRLELQYKSKFDKQWQSRTSKCCSVGEQGFDSRKCYSFRVRLKRLVPYCNVVNYSSDWEAETFWMNGTLLGNSCATFVYCLSTNAIVLSCLLAVILMMLILLILLCKWQRLQKSVMPSVPDPKHIFDDLFSDHNGNFQVNIAILPKNPQFLTQEKSPSPHATSPRGSTEQIPELIESV
uniref:Cytokine receptor-like factor 2 n=1 Tax=Amazona collaria TaxID=241587 RepID=A0A8B9FRJ5_9PSIT